jgi:hypothetical protein
LLEPSPEAVEGLELPNLEDPSDLLTPSRLALRDPLLWTTMPLPWCTDWKSLGAFPRTAFYGVTVPFSAAVDDLPEVKRGYVPRGVIQKGIFPGMSLLRMANAASLGLELPLFTGDTASTVEFRLTNLHPRESDFRFRLPPSGPSIQVDGRGGHGALVATEPVIHHVVIEPDADRVSVVWRGATPVLRRYTVEEMLRMPLNVSWPEEP